MKVLLDTDIMSYIFAHRDDHVRKRFLTFAIGDIGISTITAAELAFGSALNRSERNRRAVERALESLAILPFDLAAARAYGQVRAALHRRGILIGPLIGDQQRPRIPPRAGAARRELARLIFVWSERCGLCSKPST